MTSNALLSALTLQIEYGTGDEKVGRCRQFPGFVIECNGRPDGEMFAALRQETMRRLDRGDQPIFTGAGKNVFTCAVHNAKTKEHHIMDIPDSWCVLSDERLAVNALESANDWISTAGPRIWEETRLIRITTKSLTTRICKAVKTARAQYHEDKAAWEQKWEAAKLKHQEDLRQQAQIKEMIDGLVAEALKYIEKGGRLIVPWATRGRQATPAETWHLRDFEKFNQRSEPPKEHRTEKKDAEGNVTGWSVQYENQNGGETMAGGEQAEFMVKCLAKYSREGDETALRWLHRLSLMASQLFWEVVEHQPEAAKRLSREWRRVPFSTDGSSTSVKLLTLKLKDLEMPTPPKTNPKIDLSSKHHIFINRVQKALHFLMSSPPISLPRQLLHEDSPDWVHRAKEAYETRPPQNEILHEVFWQIYEAAMTRTPESPWIKQSRPRKEKEKFIKAVRVRLESQD